MAKKQTVNSVREIPVEEVGRRGSYDEFEVDGVMYLVDRAELPAIDNPHANPEVYVRLYSNKPVKDAYKVLRIRRNPQILDEIAGQWSERQGYQVARKLTPVSKQTGNFLAHVSAGRTRIARDPATLKDRCP